MAFRATYNGGILESKGIGVGYIPTYYFFSGLALLSQGFFFDPGDIWWNNDPYITVSSVWTLDSQTQSVTWADANEIQSVIWAECDCGPVCD